MLDVLRKHTIGDTVEAQTARFIGTDAAADGLSKRLVMLNTFMRPIATFVRPKI